MKKVPVLYLLVMLMFVGQSHAFMQYDRAIATLQKGDVQGAKNLMQAVITENPDNPSALYDAGVVSYKAGDFSQAHAYFAKAAGHDKASPALQKNAYFNAGNAAVELQELKQALKHYEQVLAIDPQDAQAKHNAEKVKEMLNQQQQQQKDQNKEQKDNKNQNNNDQNKSDQSPNQQNQSQNKDQSDNSKESQNQNKSDQQQQQQQNDANDVERKKEEQKSDQQKQEDQQRAEKERKRNAEQQQNRERQQPKAEHERDAQGKKQDQEQGNHNQPHKDSKSASVAQNQLKAEDEKKQESAGAAGKQKQQPPLETWLAELLEDQEKKDAHANKMMIKSAVDQNRDEDGQNSW